MTKCILLNCREVDIKIPILYNFSGGDFNVIQNQKNNKGPCVAFFEFCCTVIQ